MHSASVFLFVSWSKDNAFVTYNVGIIFFSVHHSYEYDNIVLNKNSCCDLRTQWWCYSEVWWGKKGKKVVNKSSLNSFWTQNWKGAAEMLVVMI